MNDMNGLRAMCHKFSIPFWYEEDEKKYFLYFGIEEDNLRFLSSFWNYFGLQYPDIFLQYFHLQDGEVIRVICDKEKLSSILHYFHHPIFLLDTSLFSYFETILSKFQESGVSATFLNGCEEYPYLLRLESYSWSFKNQYLKHIWKNRLYNDNSCFGFPSFPALKRYMYEMYNGNVFEQFMRRLKK